MYRFFSRRQGWPDGMKVKYFESQIIDDSKHITLKFVDKTGK